MDTTTLIDLLEELDGTIDDLEENINPLTKIPLSESAVKLSLLERAKLHVLVTYAIESVLFSFLRLQGVDAKAHPVFRELTRTKLYFEKLKVAEYGEPKRENLSLDKPAAGRFIKHALAGNNRHDLERIEQQARAKVEALKKLQATGKRKVEASEDADLENHESPREGETTTKTQPDESDATNREKNSAKVKRKGKKQKNKHRSAET